MAVPASSGRAGNFGLRQADNARAKTPRRNEKHDSDLTTQHWKERRMNAQEIIDLEQKYVLGVYSRPPFVLERGEGCVLYDSEGRAYLDCAAGIAVNDLGYADAGVNQAIREAAGTGM